MLDIELHSGVGRTIRGDESAAVPVRTIPHHVDRKEDSR